MTGSLSNIEYIVFKDAVAKMISLAAAETN